MTLIAQYALFAMVAIAVNIGVQAAFLRVYGGALAVPLSILAGTLAGLVVKYISRQDNHLPVSGRVTCAMMARCFCATA